MSERVKMPDRRLCWRQTVRIADANGVQHRFYLEVGEYEDGRPGEIWVEANKEGTFTRGVVGTLARMASIALQCGASLNDVAHAMRHLSFPPAGKVEGECTPVRECSSVPDWIAQELLAQYGKGEADAVR